MIIICKIAEAIPDADWNFYCGRPLPNNYVPSGMINAELGNPYIINLELTRNKVIELFGKELEFGKSERAENWRIACKWMANEIIKGKTIKLFCWCKNDPSKKGCHLDKIKNYIYALFPPHPPLPNRH